MSESIVIEPVTNALDHSKFYVDFLPQALPIRFEAKNMEGWLQFFQEARAVFKCASPVIYDDVRISQLMEVLALVQDLPSGDYAEMGTLHGHTTRIIWRMMRLNQPNRKLYCFDTFKGFDQGDLDVEAQRFPHQWTTKSFGAVMPLDEVIHNITDDDGPDESLELVVGRVPESLEPYNALSLRFVHIDMDLYQPIKSALEWSWPRLVPGGIIVTHDYSTFLGTRTAVNEFCQSVGLVPLPMGDRYGSAMVAKPTR